MQITGEMLIGRTDVRGSAGALEAFDPTRGERLTPAFGAGTVQDVERACQLAAAAFDPFRALPLATRAEFLEAVAQAILDLGDALIERAHAETGLPVARLQGERGRTAGQLRMFARVVRDGHFLDATIDPAQPAREPLPRSDLRLAKIGLGPVAVFGASNFPLAFSVAGGDTASAFAAGCPVIVKAHSAHLGTSELVARAVRSAVQKLGLPEGVFSLLVGERAVGEALVAHPAIAAVGFTGSRNGGLALQRIAQARAVPIPVYAEMSSINPVYLLPEALAARGDAIARGFVDSLTMGAGQFCTNPGLVLGIAGDALERFCLAATEALTAKAAGTMLTPGIHQAYDRGVARLADEPNVTVLARGQAGSGCQGQAALFRTTASEFLATPALHDEVFGPASVVIACDTVDEMIAITERLEGQLTATLQLDAGDTATARRLLPSLERRAGRILANGFPTGVEVCHAMVHGGPFPATSNAMFTSVGATAIDRFLRPVCYQDLPDALLPEALRQENPLGLWRLVDGALKQA
ncbi:aldehyde dehydrogenase (NADP(+)) [Pandoraea apista]|uniref:Aldehyde dehydrogenase (NADP(+)) n=1 Tax=Pandoraea apista TaxID=93218 RepID=A0ABX9ZSX0_9BURK|nr:aldehyde dehydrogenase (NADP(+)) [Pandoraea apista]PTE01376.1 aldehyde dehydrogenase (NADP(+)) [Pandoraea apista]RRJ30906.1 aldehyde dehydrogenase (NADP(+)) [Pandoraea apista]RRJ79513.1 aldehyde dehydrogenase (NADP(+)) [Pandoraea apista]RSD12387.1 aldehyde dehydrogenase (NADP(+)) [Pandoraea apista]RSD22619.1 aldehyde dehydrogenase (NADP(+)) [Pandoraea apista]